MAREALDAISQDEFERANEAGEAEAARGTATAVRYYATERRLSVRLSTGVSFTVPVDLVQGLALAPDPMLRDVLISPGGLGLHFPQLDADISVPGLLDGVFGTAKWMAQLGRQAGGDRGAGMPPRPVKRPTRYVQGHMHGDRAVAVTIQEGGHAYQEMSAAEALQGLLAGEFEILPSDSPVAMTLRPAESEPRGAKDAETGRGPDAPVPEGPRPRRRKLGI